MQAVGQGEKSENWLELCLQAADDEDEGKFMALMREINPTR
jgi:hypothetical protein